MYSLNLYFWYLHISRDTVMLCAFFAFVFLFVLLVAMFWIVMWKFHKIKIFVFASNILEINTSLNNICLQIMKYINRAFEHKAIVDSNYKNDILKQLQTHELASEQRAKDIPVIFNKEISELCEVIGNENNSIVNLQQDIIENYKTQLRTKQSKIANLSKENKALKAKQVVDFTKKGKK